MVPPPDSSADPLIPWVASAVFLVSAGLCVALAAPGAHWLDSAEFAAASFELGNAHPPGHPLAIILGKAATFLPLGGIAFRVNCASGLAIGVAAVLLLLCIRRLTCAVWLRVQQGHACRLLRGDGQPRPEASEAPRPMPPAVLWPVCVAGSLGFALSHATMLQGVRAEVYGLNLAMSLGVLHLTLRYLVDDPGRARDLVAAGLLLGLGLCNHHLLTLTVLPAVLVAVALARRPSMRARLAHVGAAAVAAMVGLATMAQLPVRSTAAPLINWGAPHTAARFLWTVSARLFARTAERSLTSSPLDRLWSLASLASSELGPGLWLCGLGLLLGMLLWRHLRPLGALTGLTMVTVAGAALAAGFEPDNPDSLGYVLLLLALGSALSAAGVGLGLALLCRRPALRRAAVALSFLLLIWPLVSLGTAWRRVDLRQAYSAEESAELLLDSVPPRGVLLTSYYQSGFGVWAARSLAGARPDVDHVHRSYLSQPGYVANLLCRRPRLRPLIGGLHAPGELDYSRLVRSARGRAVLFEFDDDTFGEDMIQRSVPFGPLCILRPPAGAGALEPARVTRASRRQWARLEALMGRHPEPLARMYLLWARYLRARYFLLRGSCSAARPSFERAVLLGNPRDPALRAMARRCGFAMPKGHSRGP